MLRFWNEEITSVTCSKLRWRIHYHGVIPHWKGIQPVKLSLRLLPLAVLALTTCLPASLFAATASTPDGNPTGPLIIIHGSPLPPDGNPTGPPKLSMVR